MDKLFIRPSSRNIRWVLTAVWALGVVVVGTVFRQNIEEASSLLGLNNLVASGVSAIFGQPYSNYVGWAFLFLSGVVATLWLQLAFRHKFNDIDENNSPPSREWARAIIWPEQKKYEHTSNIAEVVISDIKTERSLAFSDPTRLRQSVELGLAKPFESVSVRVYGLNSSIVWSVTRLGLTQIKVELEGTDFKYPVAIEIVQFAREGEAVKLDQRYRLLEFDYRTLPRQIPD